MCDFHAQNQKIIDIHLATCEIYKCGQCDYKTRKLSQVEVHIKHKNGSGDEENWLKQSKQSGWY